MATIIVEGRTPRDLDFVLAVCREKVRKGELTLTSFSEHEAKMAEMKSLNESANAEIESLKAQLAALKNDDVKDVAVDEDLKEIDIDKDDKSTEVTDTKEVKVTDAKTKSTSRKSK